MRAQEQEHVRSADGETVGGGRSPVGTTSDGGRRTLRRLGLFVLAFASGFAVLTIEIAGARMIAPVFGLSAVPWTAVIGVILAALAVGSHLGGRLADRGTVPLALILTLAGVTAVLPVLGGEVPWVARDVLGFIPGAVASAVLLFAPSVLCLGAVVPFLVQADTESLGTVGRRAGDLSAAATAGSIAGSFATGFVLLPLVPLPTLMAVTAVMLFVMAALAGRLLVGRVSDGSLVMAALAVGAVTWISDRPADSVVHREQTLYASVQVTERPWADGRRVRELWQNGGSSSAEYVDDGRPAHPYATASLDLLDDVLARAGSVLVLGGAALTLPVAFLERHPDLAVDVVEIDPAVTRIARTHFAAGKLPPDAMRVVHEDARVYLRATDRRYDVVYMDVFDHLLTVPWTMVTREAFAGMAARLEPGGLFVANVLSPLDGPGAAFLRRLRATLEDVFGETRFFLVTPEEDRRVTQNVIVVAGADEATLPAWSGEKASVPARGRAFTDEWAPVEYLQARVFMQGLGWD
ncbi:MAG: fused MFS/spermidine synthase [Gemmatimonadota bacterium]|nr:fused MFS/spermidine synthase [Gemmatimonadota bacterium]